ncbi:hypothetical protein JOC78_003405 [Bacillus ectoiniformans]|uniref:hypothetical protein n=1 Tax=Bacillus ectoiniformans TaxID=1494429 RepID=UPI00195CF4C8|nr:hypothetical protein [Bacillus ectoiniformans]MBM7650415.1 hypothetical protein [Bacillus ectoiniformans]
MNEKLVIFWEGTTPDIDAAEVIQYQKSFFHDKKIKQLIKSAKGQYKNDCAEHITKSCAFYVTHVLEETDDLQGNRVKVYEGQGNDYTEFMIVLNTLLSLINTSSEKCTFIIKLAAELKYVNREVGTRFIDDLANEVYKYMRS